MGVYRRLNFIMTCLVLLLPIGAASQTRVALPDPTFVTYDGDDKQAIRIGTMMRIIAGYESSPFGFAEMVCEASRLRQQASTIPADQTEDPIEVLLEAQLHYYCLQIGLLRLDSSGNEVTRALVKKLERYSLTLSDLFIFNLPSQFDVIAPLLEKIVTSEDPALILINDWLGRTSDALVFVLHSRDVEAKRRATDFIFYHARRNAFGENYPVFPLLLYKLAEKLAAATSAKSSPVSDDGQAVAEALYAPFLLDDAPNHLVRLYLELKKRTRPIPQRHLAVNFFTSEAEFRSSQPLKELEEPGQQPFVYRRDDVSPKGFDHALYKMKTEDKDSGIDDMRLLAEEHAADQRSTGKLYPINLPLRFTEDFESALTIFSQWTNGGQWYEIIEVDVFAHGSSGVVSLASDEPLTSSNIFKQPPTFASPFADGVGITFWSCRTALDKKEFDKFAEAFKPLVLEHGTLTAYTVPIYYIADWLVTVQPFPLTWGEDIYGYTAEFSDGEITIKAKR